jgi:exonuclease I
MDFQNWQLARTHETTAIAKRNKKGSKSLVDNSSAQTKISTLLKITHKCDPSTIPIAWHKNIKAGSYALDELDDIACIKTLLTLSLSS